jgi:hypothetical protein
VELKNAMGELVTRSFGIKLFSKAYRFDTK